MPKHFLKKHLIMLILALSPIVASHCYATPKLGELAPHGNYYTFQKVVYQNDGGWPDNKAYFRRFLAHIGAHLTATDGKVEIRVVSFAAGVQLFVMAREDTELAQSIDGLRNKGVHFLICRNTLDGLKLRPSDLYGVKEGDVVPSGVAELARLQGMGFVYIHP